MYVRKRRIGAGLLIAALFALLIAALQTSQTPSAHADAIHQRAKPVVIKKLTAADLRLKSQQQRYLDPEADDGMHPELTDPAQHVGEHTHERMAQQMGMPGDDTELAQANDTVVADAPLPGSTGGSWAYGDQLPKDFYAIHTVVGVNSILLVAGSGNSASMFAAGTFKSYVCSSGLTSCRAVPTPKDLFCSGHVLLPDGRALVGGGTLAYGAWKGAKYLYAFDFKRERYVRLAPLEVGRWYPTLVTTINGSTLITGGFDENGKLTNKSELFDYRTNRHHMLKGSHTFPFYPRLELTIKKNFFFSGVGQGAYTGTAKPGFWDPEHGNKFVPVKGLRTPKQRSEGGTCFVGDARNQDLIVLGGGDPVTDTTDTIKLSDKTPRFRPGPTMKAKKKYMGCTILPDGSVLEFGGGTHNKIESASNEAGLLPSISSQWQSMNPVPDGNNRLYHSVAILLNDGRVASFGSNPKKQARSTSVLFFSPPYLFKGERPTITAIPKVIKRYSTITVSTTGEAKYLLLTKPSSTTHGLNADAKEMKFPIVDGKVDLSGGWARFIPSGYYQAWGMNDAGAISVASIVKIQ